MPRKGTPAKLPKVTNLHNLSPIELVRRDHPSSPSYETFAGRIPSPLKIRESTADDGSTPAYTQDFDSEDDSFWTESDFVTIQGHTKTPGSIGKGQLMRFNSTLLENGHAKDLEDVTAPLYLSTISDVEETMFPSLTSSSVEASPAVPDKQESAKSNFNPVVVEKKTESPINAELVKQQKNLSSTTLIQSKSLPNLSAVNTNKFPECETSHTPKTVTFSSTLTTFSIPSASQNVSKNVTSRQSSGSIKTSNRSRGKKRHVPSMRNPMYSTKSQRLQISKKNNTRSLSRSRKRGPQSKSRQRRRSKAKGSDKTPHIPLCILTTLAEDQQYEQHELSSLSKSFKQAIEKAPTDMLVTCGEIDHPGVVPCSST